MELKDLIACIKNGFNVKRNKLLAQTGVDYQQVGNDLAKLLLGMRMQIQARHWETESHAEHVALDMLMDNIIKKGDKLIEAYMGLFGRVSLRFDCGFLEPIKGRIKSALNYPL